MTVLGTNLLQFLLTSTLPQKTVNYLEIIKLSSIKILLLKKKRLDFPDFK